jgi:ribosomal protein S7
MPRRREVQRREVLPDPKFQSTEVAKFMNVIMLSGKKAVAERIIYGAFDSISTKAGKDPLEVFNAAINNVKPVVEVKSRRVGGATFQVPVEVRQDRRTALALPESALVRRDGNSYLMKVDAQNRVQETKVQTGRRHRQVRAWRAPVLPRPAHTGPGDH